MRTRRMVVVLVIAVALVAAACSSSTPQSASQTADETTTTIELPDLEFGRGVMPVSVPAAWPMPEQAVIGSTMIDGVNGRTEVVVTYPAAVLETVAYYTTNLPIVGFEIISSDGSDGEWTIEFAGEGVTGSAFFKIAGASVTAGTLTFNTG